ncbi:hypothetical protein ACQJBY_011104 [Aegilops geniculata]
MEAAASSLSSLLVSLRVDGPWTPPAAWDSIAPESASACVPDPAGRPSRDPIYELTSVPDAALVRLALHALHGVKSSLDEIVELSVLFSSSPADRTSHRIANVWSRSSSTASIGHILNSIGSTGLAVFFLRKFVHYYLFQSREVNCGNREGHGHDVSDDKDTEHSPPYSLVNQAFAAAVEKVLEGYFCSLNTLPPSIKLRRSVGQLDRPSMTSDRASCNSSSEITLLEVYLHTEELRRHIKSLGNICFPKFAGLALCQEGLTTDSNLEFENFPRGTDLLSYLYVRLRDADPVHYALLKYLFIRSCEPYCNFIKLWIYQASVDDPYEEFLITQTENSQIQGGSLGPLGVTALPFKGSNHVSVPCFLKDICNPLLRTGQQLQVLMKVVKSCNLCSTGGDNYDASKTILLEEILPWFGTPIECSVNSFTFSKSKVEAVICQRDAMYKSMLEKLHHFFLNIEIIPFGPPSNSLHKSKSLLDTSVSDVELLYGGIHALPTCDIMSADEKDNDAYSTSQESSDKLDPLESSECSSSYSSMDEIEVESGITCGNLSSSRFSLYYASTGEAKCSSETQNVLSHQTSSRHNGTNSSSPNDEHHRNVDLGCSNVPMHSQNVEHNVMPDALELDYQYSKFWPFGKFPKNTFNSSPGEMCLVDEFLYTDNESAVEQVSHDDVVYPSSHTDKSCKINHSWNSSISYNLSTNPILKNAAGHHMESDLRGKWKNQALESFAFESVTNPCEVYCERSTSLVESEAGATKVVHSTAQKQPDCSSELLQAKTGSQGYLASSGETEASDNLPKNVCGGALWEKLLEYTAKSTEKIAGDSSSASDMPLDIAIDKCIIQEVLLQYKYVSSFTMKLLEEGFDLCGHLLALRRYHFMELADWAESFIVSIYHKKWFSVKSEQKRAEIQGLLDLAMQRSSCDTDPYKEKLFIYMKEQPVISVAASEHGFHMLDDFLLGYKVDWPVNIVITEEALRRYAEIFCYLVQVRFAVFSLTEVWRFLKELTQLISRSGCSRPDILKRLNSVMKVRHQVYHFLSTLQQYHHCNLSDISWRRFQHSLKHQVKDMRDIEYVHLCYVTDALHICFLSNETKPVATIIKSMLQQALEFRSCFKSLNDLSESTVNQLNLHSLINFSQVDAIKTRFESNIKDLYILHSKSSKYEELGLSRFWVYLNYNEYHSLKITKDVGCFYF